MAAKMSTVLLLLLLMKPGWAQDSLNVTHLGQWNYWGQASDVAISGSYTYVTENEYGLRVVDVSDPADMEEIGQCAIQAGYCVAVNGPYAYVGTYNGLLIVDIANPAAPETLASCNIGDWIRSVVFAPPFVYAAAWNGGLLIINVSNPTAPLVVGRFDSPGVAQEVALAGTLAYLADGDRGFWIVDVSNPARPRPISNAATPYYAHNLTVADPFVYVLDGEGIGSYGGGLMIFDASDPTRPVLLGRCGPYVEATDVKVSGYFAYVAIPGRGLRVIDISQPTTPHEVCIFHDDGYAVEIELAGALAFTAGGLGLTTLDLAIPIAPVNIGNYDPDAGAAELEVERDYAYVCKYGRGLDILDVSDLSNPRWLGFCPSQDDAEDVAVRPPYAYLADGNGGLRIIDASDPENPIEVGFYDPGIYVYGVALNYPYAYLACWTDGLQTIDVSDPTNPVQVSSWSWVSLISVTVAGAYAYAGTSPYTSPPGLRTFSLANPAAPFEISGVTFSGSCYEIAVAGSYACVATSSGLRIVDVSNIGLPTLVYGGSSWSSYDVDAAGSLVYLSSQAPILRVLNISDPTAPVQVGYYQTSSNGSGLGLDVVDSIAYLGRDCIFDIYDCSACTTTPNLTLLSVNSPAALTETLNPSSLFLVTCAPNPFNPTTAFRFELTVASFVTLEVFDVNGRSVGADLRPAQDGWYPAGPHQITFDGTDLPSGIYFVKLLAGEQSAVQKLVLLK